jgi:tripartite-type tricarboxylate transporter receptor subunit TctC
LPTKEAPQYLKKGYKVFQLLQVKRRAAITALSLLGLTMAAPLSLQAQTNFPTKTIRLIVPFPAGGPTDIFARQYAIGLSRVLNQSVIVDNKAGASGAIGSLEVKRSQPDGHTLLFGTASNLALYNLMALKPQYDYLKDFTTVAVVGGSAVVFMANKESPQTLRALIDQAKANPTKFRYGSPGQGTYLHLSMERFLLESGAKIEHIPYKGSGQAKPALLGGQTETMVDALGSALPLHQGGQAKILAIASNKRSSLAPDVPTVNEALGIKGFEAVLWNGIAAPAGTPKAIIDLLAAATAKVLKDPVLVDQLNKLAMEPTDSTPESATEYIKEEMARWKPVIEKTGLRIE